MKYVAFIMFMLLLATIANAEPVRVAVIDSGYNGDRSHLCKDGHYDYIDNVAEAGRDQQGHGTDVTNAIIEYADGANICIVVLKVFGKKGQYNLGTVARAIQRATAYGAKVLNMSLDGSYPVPEERQSLVEALSKRMVIFVAAGNDKYDLDINCRSYPACYRLPGVFVVGGQDEATGQRRGNFGAIVDEYEPWCYNGRCGTSLSTGIATGKFAAGYK